jgi:hypothetical protein
MNHDPFSPDADPYPPKKKPPLLQINRRETHKLLALSTVAMICQGCVHVIGKDNRMPADGYKCDAPFCRYHKRGAPPI